jgi:hypothetical protein
MNLVEAILYGAGVLVIGLLVILSVRLHFKNKSTFVDLVQSETNLMAIMSHLEDVEKERELEKSEGFIKFLSESRDWAFDYIEEAQSIVKDFLTKSDKMFLGTDVDPELLISYRKLRALLPDEEAKS